MAFIQEYLPASCKITFVGHSIGCKIIMEIMKKLEAAENDLSGMTGAESKLLSSLSNKTMQKCLHSYFLFPTIERMKSTPAGRRVWIQVISQTKRELGSG